MRLWWLRKRGYEIVSSIGHGYDTALLLEKNGVYKVVKVKYCWPNDVDFRTVQ